MKKHTTKADSRTRRLSPDRLFAVSYSSPLHIRERLYRARTVALAGTQKNLIKIVFTGTAGLTGALFVLLLASYLIYGNDHVLPRIIAFLPVVIYIAVVAYFIYIRRNYAVSAWMLLILYSIIATTLLWFWSINAQIGILALGFVIILAGTILNAKYILPVTIGIIIVLTLLQLANELGFVEPDTEALAKSSTFGDVISYGVIFGIFALITWLSRRQMEQALIRALDAEAEVEKEKSLLAVRLEEQTRHLREVQLDEMQQLYRFAEVGQLSTALLHELANRLTVLTLDIDDLGQRHHQSEEVAHAKESIEYLDTMVNQVRRQLQENNDFEEFNVLDTIQETAQTLQPKAIKSGLTLAVTRHGNMSDLHAFGDPLRLSQIVTILVTNAIDAYNSLDKLPESSTIEINISAVKKHIEITVTDHAGGISDYHRSQLFIPFKSTKQTGMGIGLYIAKHMTETHFKGSLSLDKRTDLTRFLINIPAYRPKK